MNRKLLTFLLALLLSLSLLAACSNNQTDNGTPSNSTGTTDADAEADNYTVRVGTLKGPTGMGMAKLIADNTTNKTKEISLYGAPEDLSAALISGNLDVAAVPVNLAAASMETAHSQAGSIFRAAITDTLHDAMEPDV